jgi:hypothetical protein
MSDADHDRVTLTSGEGNSNASGNRRCTRSTRGTRAKKLTHVAVFSRSSASRSQQRSSARFSALAANSLTCVSQRCAILLID